MPAMRGPRLLFFYSLIAILYFFAISSCAPASSHSAFFFYLRQPGSPTLVLLDSPDAAQPVGELPLPPSPGCRFGSLIPAPKGALVAVEWQCPFGPLTQVADLGAAKILSLSDDPALDMHFLAWNPDGKSLYLKAGVLSNPQILRVDVASRQTTAMPIPPETYSLEVSPADGTIVWALTKGIGRGSQVWGSDAGSISSQMVLADPTHIIGLMRYSPDGKTIAAIRLPDDQSALPPGELWLSDSEGKHPHFAARADAGRGMFPVWSPDGEKIAFIGRDHPRDPDSINISILNISTLQLSTFAPSNLHPSTFQPVFPPTWSPDGSRLYLTLGADGKMGLWSYEISTGAAQKLFDDACCAGWTH